MKKLLIIALAALCCVAFAAPAMAKLQMYGGIQVDTFYWEASKEIPENYTVFTHLVDCANKIWGQHDGPPAEGFLPTTSWITGIPVRDPHRLPLPADIPSGEYRIEVGMYLADTGERLPVTDEQGTTSGDRILLDSIRVEAR